MGTAGMPGQLCGKGVGFGRAQYLQQAERREHGRRVHAAFIWDLTKERLGTLPQPSRTG